MKKLICLYLLLLIIPFKLLSQKTLAIPIDNTWVTDYNNTEDDNISIANNEITIISNKRNTKSIYKKNIPSNNLTNGDLYIQAEVRIENVTNGTLAFHTPKIKILDSNTGNALSTLNIKHLPKNEYSLVISKISNFHKKNIDFIDIEVLTQSVTGLIKFKNFKLLDTQPNFEYQYPFDNINNTDTSIEVSTDKYHIFENDLLSTNSHFSWVNYSWDSPKVITAINNNFPMTNMRFPGGTVGNFYSYENDGFYNNEYTQYSTTAQKGVLSGHTFGFNGYKDLCGANNASSTLMFNLVTDNENVSLLRYKDRYNKLIIKWIELGNETYFKDQKIGLVNTDEKYIDLATKISNTIKGFNNSQKIAVNIHSDDFSENSWNDKLWNHRHIFDAVVMHPYFNNTYASQTKASVYHYMNTYKEFNDKMIRYKKHYIDNGVYKPIIMTEWGVLTNGVQNNFSQVLASADMFLAIEKANSEGIVKQAGIHMLYHTDKHGESTLIYELNNKIVLTPMGVMYASLFDTFKNNKVLDAYSNGPILEDGIEGVRAKVIDTGNMFKVFIVNKMNTSSNLNLSFDGVVFKGPYDISTFKEHITEPLTTSYSNKEAAWSHQNLNETISIPANSINIVTIDKNTLLSNDTSEFLRFFKINNVSNNYINIKTSKKIKNYHIYNQLGKIILNEGFNENININSLSIGIYFLILTDTFGNRYKTKIIKY